MPRRRDVEKTQCTTCANAVWDPVWGEYKCTSLKHVIYRPENFENCIYYLKGIPKESRDSNEIAYE